jgi:hypothetical protein
MWVVLAGLAACAAQPPERAVTTTPAPTAAPEPAPATDDKVAPRIPSGYRLVKKNGQNLYCRTVTPTGTRFSEKLCLTATQIKQTQQINETTMRAIDRAQRVCAGADCGSN